MAKSLSFALAALLLLAPACLLQPRRVTHPLPANTGDWPLPPGSRRSASAAIPIILRRPKRSNRLPAGRNEPGTHRGAQARRGCWPGAGAMPNARLTSLQSLGIHVLQWVQTSTIEEIIATLRELAQWSPQPEKARAGGAGDAAGIRCVESALCQRADETRLPAVRLRTAVHQRPRFDSRIGC